MVWTSGHCHIVAAESQGIWHPTQVHMPKPELGSLICDTEVYGLYRNRKNTAPNNFQAGFPVQLRRKTLPNRSLSVNMVLRQKKVQNLFFKLQNT